MLKAWHQPTVCHPINVPAIKHGRSKMTVHCRGREKADIRVTAQYGNHPDLFDLGGIVAGDPGLSGSHQTAAKSWQQGGQDEKP